MEALGGDSLLAPCAARQPCPQGHAHPPHKVDGRFKRRLSLHRKPVRMKTNRKSRHRPTDNLQWLSLSQSTIDLTRKVKVAGGAAGAAPNLQQQAIACLGFPARTGRCTRVFAATGTGKAPYPTITTQRRADWRGSRPSPVTLFAQMYDVRSRC